MIQEIDIKELTLLERNPRRIKAEQMEKLIESLKTDPDYLKRRPVLVNRVNDVLTVYAGNQRVKAAKKLKWKTIPCIIDDDLDEKTLKERIVKDNKTYGEFDYDALANEFDVNMLLEAGFTFDDLHLDAMKSALDIHEEPKEEKEKHQKECPNCGYVL